jgi:hypothetical protein
MDAKISKTNENLAFFNARLDEVRMSGYERLAAKARLAQTEAIADAIFELAGFAKRLLKSLAARPPRRSAPSAG